MTTMVLAGVVLAAPAYAQSAVNAVSASSYNAVVSLSCVAEDTTDGGKEKLLTVKANNREIIAWCNFLDPTDPDDSSAISDAVREQVVVVDASDHLRVIDRCTQHSICFLDLASGSSCSRAHNESGNTQAENAVCILEPGTLENLDEDITVLEFNGSLRCKDQHTAKGVNESLQAANGSAQFSFRTGCHGYPSVGISMYEETVPCTMNISTGSLFKVPKNCEVPQ